MQPLLKTKRLVRTLQLTDPDSPRHLSVGWRGAPFIALYFYELPTHHCPFCILQKEYRHVGYILYGCLLGGVISEMGCGVAELAKGRNSLEVSIRAVQKKAAVAALLLNCGFTAIVVTRILTTLFRI